MCGVPKTVVRDSHVRETVRPFMLDSRPVNNAEWRAFCEATRRETPPWMFKRGFEHPDQPVVGVSADEARAFARWAGKRLPTEAEWLAAFGDARYPWGDFPPSPTRACFGHDPRRPRTGPPAPQRTGLDPDTGAIARAAGAGPYGHLDLAGLVWEHLEPSHTPLATRGSTVARGGFWGAEDPHRDLRIIIAPHERTAGLGLRCAR
jgi:formylglycine-generating enzyme required for sulfatase activity